MEAPKKEQVCLFGLGQVGLPLACVLATSGYTVRGVDSDEDVVRQLRRGKLKNPDSALQILLEKALLSGDLEITAQASPADIYIVAVPTLLTPDNQPDISSVEEAMEAIGVHIRSNDLILLESTCPVGTTERMRQSLKNSCEQFFMAYCPERILPGNVLFELIHNDRVVGGVDPESTKRAAAFYQSFTKGQILSTDARTAEAVKLAENAFRDVNIAYANELSMIAGKLHLDINEIIKLANRHPRVNILKPGVGVGGHCIAIDPWYLVDAAPECSRLIATAREVNGRKTQWVIQKIREAIGIKQATAITCLGLTYKPNVADIRESPAMAVVEILEKEISVFRVDPYIPESASLFEAFSHSQIIVTLVPHDSFFEISPYHLQDKTLLDFAGIFV